MLYHYCYRNTFVFVNTPQIEIGYLIEIGIVTVKSFRLAIRTRVLASQHIFHVIHLFSYATVCGLRMYLLE